MRVCLYICTYIYIDTHTYKNIYIYTAILQFAFFTLNIFQWKYVFKGKHIVSLNMFQTFLDVSTYLSGGNGISRCSLHFPDYQVVLACFTMVVGHSPFLIFILPLLIFYWRICLFFLIYRCIFLCAYIHMCMSLKICFYKIDVLYMFWSLI